MPKGAPKRRPPERPPTEMEEAEPPELPLPLHDVPESALAGAPGYGVRDVEVFITGLQSSIDTLNEENWNNQYDFGYRCFQRYKRVVENRLLPVLVV